MIRDRVNDREADATGQRSAATHRIGASIIGRR